jgi:hypothetical protein
LLEIAISKNLSRATQLIVNSGVDLNFVSLTSRFGKEPAFLAASLGRYDIFSIILANSRVLFYSESSGKSLLHEILTAKHIEIETVEAMFALVLSDLRCCIDIINAEDIHSKSPLHYACVKRFDSITLRLLENGAYIGSKNIVDIIEPNLVTKFLDQCLVKLEDEDNEEKILIDYQFLIPSVGTKVEQKALENIADNAKFNDILKHPVMTSFLDLKFRVIRWIVAFKLMIHYWSLTFLVVASHSFVSKEYKEKQESMIFTIFVYILVFMAFVEVFQMITRYQTYFLKFNNWFDLMTLATGIYVLVLNKSEFLSEEVKKKLYTSTAFLNLFVSAQSMWILNITIYHTIYRKVSSSFLKLLWIYITLFLNFALSFHLLFKADPTKEDDEYTNFGTETIARFRVFTMFVGDLDGKSFDSPLKMVMLLLFIFFMMIILQNLMNSIALIDAQEIFNEAKLILIKKTISQICSYERFFGIFNIKFSIFSTECMNRFELTPSRGRQLVLFNPLNVRPLKSKLNPNIFLVLSKKSCKEIKRFCDAKK